MGYFSSPTDTLKWKYCKCKLLHLGPTVAHWMSIIIIKQCLFCFCYFPILLSLLFFTNIPFSSFITHIIYLSSSPKPFFLLHPKYLFLFISLKPISFSCIPLLSHLSVIPKRIRDMHTKLGRPRVYYVTE